jgi:hypothetical protein
VELMAKISARGAKEIARVKATSEASGASYIYLLTSDGRVLMRASQDNGFTVAHRVRNPDNINREFLIRFVGLRGLTVV